MCQTEKQTNNWRAVRGRARLRRPQGQHLPVSFSGYWIRGDSCHQRRSWENAPWSPRVTATGSPFEEPPLALHGSGRQWHSALLLQPNAAETHKLSVTDAKSRASVLTSTLTAPLGGNLTRRASFWKLVLQWNTHTHAHREKSYTCNH